MFIFHWLIRNINNSGQDDIMVLLFYNHSHNCKTFSESIDHSNSMLTNMRFETLSEKYTMCTDQRCLSLAPETWPREPWIYEPHGFINYEYHYILITHHNGQWRGSLLGLYICAWTNAWANNRNNGDLRRHRAYHDIAVMSTCMSTISHIFLWDVISPLCSNFRLLV